MGRPIILLGALVAALLGLMASKSLLIEVPQVRAHSLAGEFDAARAKARLAVILGDQRAHPVDSPADDLVRSRIVAELQALGLRPVERDQLVCNELTKMRGVRCARVRNVIATLGPQSGKAVLLNAHYDSVAAGPGASDDGMGVATLLELGSLLRDQPLKRRVVLLFNEGEEPGLLGARAFLADPLSLDVDSLVNLEARGVEGPSNMFETNRPNGAAIALYSSVVEHPFANSLATDVYRLLPNSTDVSSFSERPWVTLNIAPMGNETRYHSPGDDVNALDPSTLQHMGDQTLSLTRALANRPFRPAGEQIFMDLSGRTLITLPLACGVVLLILMLATFAALALVRGEVATGTVITLGTIAGSAILSWVMLALIGELRPGMFWRAHPLWTHLAGYASVILVALVLLGWGGRKAEVRQLRVSFWLLYLGIGAMVALLAPGAIIFFLFPPLLALLGIISGRWWRPSETIGAILALVLLFLTLAELLALLEELLDQGPMWLFAPFGTFILLPILIEAKPLLQKVRLRRSIALAGTAALACWALAVASPAYSEDRQQRFVIEHVTDASRGKTFWSVVNDGAPLPADFHHRGPWRRATLPFDVQKRWIAPASPDPSLKAPDVEVLASLTSGEERTMTLRLVANGNERVALVAPEDSRIRSAGIPGFVRPIDQNETGRYLVECVGRSCDGLVLEIVADRTSPIRWLVVGSRAGLPATGADLVGSRPKFARPQYNPDESIAFVRRAF